MLSINEATKDNCYGKCTNCNNTELPNIKDCKKIDIGYSYAYKTDCAGDRYIKAEEVKYLLECERSKAIDDFAEKLKSECRGHCVDCDPYFGGITDSILYEDDIEEIAEQLKAGVGNGT